jgi:ribose transport system permease protein
MKKRLSLTLAILLAAAGCLVLVAVVSACQHYNDVLFLSGAQRAGIIVKAEAAGDGGLRLLLFRNAYFLLVPGAALLALAGVFLKRFAGDSKKFAKVIKLLLTDYRPLLILLLVTLVFSGLSSRFFSVLNFTNILKQISHYAILAAGVYFAILLGGIDISVGSVLAFSGAMSAVIISGMPGSIWSAAYAIAAALVIGLAAGLANGYFIARRRLQPMIVTLATMSIFRGATMVLLNGASISIAGKKYAGAPAFTAFGQKMLGGWLPVTILVMLAVYCLVYFFLNRTAFGRHMYAIGGNEEASLLSGINVARTKIIAYMSSGLMAAIAGIIVTARVASATPTAGQSYEMDAIAAVVIGGTSLRGGEGKVLYTIVGALIIGMLNNILTLSSVDAYYQTIIKGVVILLAVLLDAKSGKK